MGQELGGAGRGPGGRNLWLLYWQPWCSQEGERNTGWASKLLPLPASRFPLLSINSFMKSESVSHPVVSDSLWPRGLQPARLLCPWDSPGKNTGVGFAISFSRGSSRPRDRTRVSCTEGRFFTIWATCFTPPHGFGMIYDQNKGAINPINHYKVKAENKM